MVNASKIERYAMMGLRKLNQDIRTRAYISTGHLLPRPLKLYWGITDKCNFRCRMCRIWERGASEKAHDYISEARVKELIDEMAALGIRELGVTGGEPLIYRRKLLNVLAYANQRGIYTHFGTNGKLLSREIIEEYDAAGGGHVSLSLDAMGRRHDLLRGYEGALAAACAAIKIFQDGGFKSTNLKLNLLITDANLDDVIDVAEFAVEQEIMIFMQPFDIHVTGFSDFQRDHSVSDLERTYDLWVKRANLGRLSRVIDRLVELKHLHPELILNEPKHLESIFDYFFRAGRTGDEGTKCFMGLDQVSMDARGKVRFCKFGEMADLSEQSLADYLDGPRRRTAVKQSLECRNFCLLGCMYRPGLLDLIRNGPRQFYHLVKN